MVKRLFDVIVATISLIVLGPILLVLGLLIRLDSPGPIFYRGERVGKDGVVFKMYKLRTMVLGADALGPMLTRGHDPRITRLGRALRKWKIDETPQLLNVLRGEMSLVGPRPEAISYVKHFNQDQLRVLSVKPGITGPAQVRFRHEEALLQQCANLEEEYIKEIMPRKLKLDLAYVQNHTLLQDLYIIVQTVACLFAKPKGDEKAQLYRVEGPL
jgi:lipopolysaccharide/colanic/teichoic acid biosynthesis glycosyltransferase